MHRKTVVELAQGLRAREFSALELAEYFLARIDHSDHNAFITITADKAREQAKAADKKLASGGGGGILCGIPYAHKDIFLSKHVKTSAGSKMLDNFIAPFDATVSAKLEDENMVMLGKTNMDEFAMGSSNENSYYGAVKNPWDKAKIPGGSSGGSAAAVAAGLAPVATATDTGGSIRQPAALCGISGLKPTYGRISRYGMVAFASSLDQAGAMARSAEDLALILKATAGFDALDSTSVDVPVPDYQKTLNAPLNGLKIGIADEFFNENLNAKIAEILGTAISEFEKMGATTQRITLKNLRYAIPAYYIIAPSECSSNLARFDGVRYGYRAKNPQNLEDLYRKSRSEGFGAEVKKRIMVGTFALSAGYYDAYYKKAQKVRRLISDDFKAAFDKIDLIFAPVSPNVAWNIGEIKDSVSMYLADIHTLPASLAGLPAMSIPAGFVDNLPVGLQMIGNYWSEAKLLNAAHQFQKRTDWHQKIADENEN